MSEEENADTQPDAIEGLKTSGLENSGIDFEEPPYEETSETEDEESEDQGEERSQPALVINVQTWATPIVGVLMLVVGLLIGYFIHPLIPTLGGEETPVAVAPANPSGVENQSSVAAAEEQPANLQEVMDYLIPLARHSKGDPEAAVTLIEFSDFQ